MFALRLAITLAMVIGSVAVLAALFPIAQELHAQHEVQAVTNLITTAAQTATKPQSLEAGFASAGETLQLSTGTQTLLTGLPLGGNTPTTQETHHYTTAIGLWVEPTGSTTFTQQALPVTITVSAQGQLGVTAGLIAALASLPSCNEIAVGFPAGATMPSNAQKVSCTTGEHEDNVSP